LGKKKSKHKNEVLRFGALRLVASKAEERPLIEHNARQNANARRSASVIPSLAQRGEGPLARNSVTQITLAAPRKAARCFKFRLSPKRRRLWQQCFHSPEFTRYDATRSGAPATRLQRRVRNWMKNERFTLCCFAASIRDDGSYLLGERIDTAWMHICSIGGVLTSVPYLISLVPSEVDTMSKTNIGETMTKLLSLLTPLSSEDRQRVISATLTLLGEPPPSSASQSTQFSNAAVVTPAASQRAAIWMRQNSLSAELIDQVFHIDGEHVEVVASHVPGKTNKERSLNVYLLAGAAKLLGTGDPTFDDKFARELCGNLGCYDSTNHTKYLKDKGNRLAGSAATGWKLTTPGLTHTAALIKQMTST
jgi:hypothetical protein